MIDDLDFSEFDGKVELTFNNIYNEFCKNNSPTDIVKVNKKRYIRANARDIIKAGVNDDVIQQIKNNPKNVPINNLTTKINNPHEQLGYSEKTSVQELVEKHIPFIKHYGSFAYSCSCGSGKTIAGLQIIHALQCRTLIISSRNAVNDQWKTIIETLYPDLIVESKGKQYMGGSKVRTVYESDIYIDTPQYLGKKIDSITIKPSLIIFDEVHSLLSKAFIRVLMYPLLKVISGEWSELPYMIALSATYPPQNSRGYNSLVKIFGKAFRTVSTIVDIPIYIWDYYDHFHNDNDDEGPKARGNWDTKYIPLDDYETIDYFADAIDGINNDYNRKLDKLVVNDKLKRKNNSHFNNESYKQLKLMTNKHKHIDELIDDDNSLTTDNNDIANDNSLTTDNNNSVIDEHITNVDSIHDIKNCSPTDIFDIDPFDINHKGLIMTYTIDSSVYAALYVHHRWNVNVLLIRSVDEPDLFIPADNYLDFEFNEQITLQDIKTAKLGINCDYKDHLNESSIIVGTFHRLKEGFSVQNITWGICTKFVWSYISRVQLAGRVRRSSNDPELNNHKRILLVSSGVRPSNLRVPKAKKPYHWKYDLDIEQQLFKYENYVKL